jgi:transcriptional regulator with XRE-family HTH domain
MSSNTDSTRQQLIESLKDKKHRRAFSDDGVQADIAIQIRVNRERRGWTQVRLAAEMGSSQGTVCKLEDPEKKGLTLSTLKQVAAAFDVALLVRFVPYGELVTWLDRPSEDKFFAVEFGKDPGIFPPPESKPEAAPETALASSWSSEVTGLGQGYMDVAYRMPASVQVVGTTTSKAVKIVKMETPKDAASETLTETAVSTAVA